jgi:hypothetical protein
MNKKPICNFYSVIGLVLICAVLSACMGNPAFTRAVPPRTASPEDELDAVDDMAEESGWAYLAGVGQKINNRSADFDPRNYGFKKLGDLFRAIPMFETEERP